MKGTTIGLDQVEEEVRTSEASDEALETAASTDKAGLWTAFCTGVACPGGPA